MFRFKRAIDQDRTKVYEKRILKIFILDIEDLPNLLYGVRNLEMSIHFSLKSRPSERFHRPEMSQIKAEIRP